VAAARARDIANGDHPKISGFDNKPIVLALREIEAGKTGVEVLEKEINPIMALAVVDLSPFDTLIEALAAYLSLEEISKVERAYHLPKRHMQVSCVKMVRLISTIRWRLQKSSRNGSLTVKPSWLLFYTTF